MCSTARTITEKSLKLLLCLALGLLIMPLISQIANAAPSIPHQFFGTVTVNSSTAAAGYVVEAKVGSTDIGDSLTDSQGRYGYEPVLMTAADAGATINFYVNGVKASQAATFASGEITRLNLTVTGTVPPPGTYSLPGSGTTISTSILGEESSFILTSSVLRTAKTLSSADGRVKLILQSSSTINLAGQTQLGAATESSPPAATDGSLLVNAYSFTPPELPSPRQEHSR